MTDQASISNTVSENDAEANPDKQQAAEFRKIEEALNDIGLNTSTLSSSDVGALVRQLLDQGVSKMSAMILEDLAAVRASIQSEKAVFEATSKTILANMQAEAGEISRIRFELEAGAGDWLVKELSQNSWCWNTEAQSLISNFKYGSSSLPMYTRNFVRFVAIAAKDLERTERWLV